MAEHKASDIKYIPMKALYNLYFRSLRTAWLCASIFFVCCSMVTAQNFRLFAVSDLDRVFEDGYKLPALSDTLKIFGIKGETISGQFTLNAKKRLTNASIVIGILKNSSSDIFLPESSAEWNFVGSIPLSKNASNQPKNAVVRQAPAKFPDYLMKEKHIDIGEGTWQSVWLTFCIPEDAAPGDYLGNVTVKSVQGDQSMPVRLTVYPLVLPAARHLKVTEWYTTDDFAKFHGISKKYSPEWFGMLRKYADNMVAHRQNIFQVPMSSITILTAGNGELAFDFSLFDQIAQVFWATGKMDYLETGELARFGEGGFSSTEISLKDFPVKNSTTGETVTMKGQEVIPYLLPAFEMHLRQKGWLEKTLFHVQDEPSHHNALKWIDISQYLHKYAPDLKRIDAVCTSFLFGNIDIAVPKLDHLDAGYEKYRMEQQKGTELWFYTVGIYQASMYPNKTIDMPLIDNRILHWLNYRYDLKGYLHWGWNQWTDNPYKDPDIHVGDGWHVYPVRDGVINSLRWEQMRNGIQDYEYFVMLENKVRALKDSLGARFVWIDPGQRGKEIISQVAIGLKEHSDDPSVLYKAKMTAIKEIMEFNTSPRIYVQTNPIEHGTLINRSVVELLGWVEPGTDLSVNGTTLPVAKDGLFMERYLIYVGEKLEITARNSKSEKVITRVFNMTY
jgi:hypothetical protein